MPGPARAGLLIYAKNVTTLSHFYEQLFGMRVLLADAMHHVIENDDMQLILHAMPPHIAAEVHIATPPAVRDEQALKPFLTVPSLPDAEARAVALGGLVIGPVWDAPGLVTRNVCDPEGNIVQLRAFI
jgi:predicted enzyme related to lactoylglutathione lyase